MSEFINTKRSSSMAPFKIITSVTILAASSMPISAVTAQIDGNNRPPIRAIDERSVDLNTLSYMYSQRFISVGPEDDEPLDYSLITTSWPAESRQSTDVKIFCDCSGDGWGTVPWDNPKSGADGYDQDAGIDLVYKGRTYQHYFNKEEGVSQGFVSVPGEPSGGVIQFTLNDGTLLNFSLKDNYCGLKCISANYIEYPNGNAWFYEYADADYGTSDFRKKYGYGEYPRTKDIYTSRGFGIAIDLSNGIGAFNKDCSTAATFCNFSRQNNTYSEKIYDNLNYDSITTNENGVSTTIKYSANQTNGLYLITKVLRSDLVEPLVENTYQVDKNYGYYPYIRAYLTNTKDANGGVTQYSLVDNRPSGDKINPDKTTEHFDYANTNDMYIDITLHRDGLNQTTTYKRDLVGRLLNQVNPEGNSTAFTRDARGNVTEKRTIAKPGTGLSDVVENWGFVACDETNIRICNKPSYYIDGKRARTDYRYDPVHGGPTVVLKPADQSGFRAVIRYDYSSFHPAANVQAPPGVTLRNVYKLSTATICKTSSVAGVAIDFSYVCPAADAAVTNYEYKPSSQASPSSFMLVSKTSVADGVTYRTCYQYDTRGNRTSETLPRSNTSTCQ